MEEKKSDWKLQELKFEFKRGWFTPITTIKKIYFDGVIKLKEE